MRGKRSLTHSRLVYLSLTSQALMASAVTPFLEMVKTDMAEFVKDVKAGIVEGLCWLVKELGLLLLLL